MAAASVGVNQPARMPTNMIAGMVALTTLWNASVGYSLRWMVPSYLGRSSLMGRPTPGHEVVIVDDESAEPIEAPGAVGEIAVRYEGDPVCFQRYHEKPEKTARKVQNGWLLTGDLGKRAEDGYLEFVSRTDNVIISSGFRIGPEEIEDSLSGYEAVADAGVLGVDHEVRDTVPKAFVVLAEGHDPSTSLREAIKDDVKARLARYEYPREIEFVNDLPKTASNKIARAELRDLQQRSDVQADAER